MKLYTAKLYHKWTDSLVILIAPNKAAAEEDLFKKATKLEVSPINIGPLKRRFLNRRTILTFKDGEEI
mgnify:CR=1 FL=1